MIGPDLKVKRSFVLKLPDIGYPLTARGRDGSGRFILAIPAWLHSRGPQKDSVVLVRFDQGSSRVDTLTVLKGAASGSPSARMSAARARTGWWLRAPT